MMSRRSFLSIAGATTWLGLLASTATADLMDPVGDTFGVGPVQHDITTYNVVYTATDLVFEVGFLSQIQAPSAGSPFSVGGFLDIDTDQDAATGASPFRNFYGIPPAALLGDEFYVDLFSEGDVGHAGFVDVLNSSNDVVGTVAITYSMTAFSLSIPLAVLGGDDGVVNYGITVATLQEFTDQVPNGVVAPTSVPEPASLMQLGLGALGLLGYARRRRGC